MEIILLVAILVVLILIYIEILRYPQRTSEGIFHVKKRVPRENPIYAKTKAVRKVMPDGNVRTETE